MEAHMNSAELAGQGTECQASGAHVLPPCHEQGCAFVKSHDVARSFLEAEPGSTPPPPPPPPLEPGRNLPSSSIPLPPPPQQEQVAERTSSADDQRQAQQESVQGPAQQPRATAAAPAQVEKWFLTFSSSAREMVPHFLLEQEERGEGQEPGRGAGGWLPPGDGGQWQQPPQSQPEQGGRRATAAACVEANAEQGLSARPQTGTRSPLLQQQVADPTSSVGGEGYQQTSVQGEGGAQQARDAAPASLAEQEQQQEEGGQGAVAQESEEAIAQQGLKANGLAMEAAAGASEQQGAGRGEGVGGEEQDSGGAGAKGKGREQLVGGAAALHAAASGSDAGGTGSQSAYGRGGVPGQGQPAQHKRPRKQLRPQPLGLGATPLMQRMLLQPASLGGSGSRRHGRQQSGECGPSSGEQSHQHGPQQQAQQVQHGRECAPAVPDASRQPRHHSQQQQQRVPQNDLTQAVDGREGEQGAAVTGSGPPQQAEAERASSAAIRTWSQLAGGGWRKAITSDNVRPNSLSITGAVLQDLGLEGSKTAVFVQLEPQRSWRVGIYDCNGASKWRLQEGYGTMHRDLEIATGDVIVVQRVPSSQWMDGTPTVAIAVERASPGRRAAMEGAGPVIAAGEGAVGNGLAEGAGPVHDASGKGAGIDLAEAAAGSGGGKRKREAEAEHGVAYTGAAGFGSPSRVKLQSAAQPHHSGWAQAPSGGVWRIVPSYFEEAKQLRLSVSVAELLGVCSSESIPYVGREYCLKVALADAARDLRAEFEVTANSSAGFTLRGCEEFDRLGIRVGTALWLGPLEGGVMPFTVSAHPAGREAQAATSGKKVIRVELEETEVAPDEGSEKVTGFSTRIKLAESAQPQASTWTAAPKGGAWRIVPPYWMGSLRLPVPMKVAEALGISSEGAILHPSITLTDPASGVKGECDVSSDTHAGFLLRRPETFGELGIKVGSVFWLGPVENGTVPFSCYANDAASTAPCKGRGAEGQGRAGKHAIGGEGAEEEGTPWKRAREEEADDDREDEGDEGGAHGTPPPSSKAGSGSPAGPSAPRRGHHYLEMPPPAQGSGPVPFGTAHGRDWSLHSDGSLSTQFTSQDIENRSLRLKWMVAERLAIHKAQLLTLVDSTSGRTWEAEVAGDGKSRQFTLQRQFGHMVREARPQVGDTLRLWPVHAGPPGQPIRMKYALELKASGSAPAPPLESSPVPCPAAHGREWWQHPNGSVTSKLSLTDVTKRTLSMRGMVAARLGIHKPQPVVMANGGRTWEAEVVQVGTQLQFLIQKGFSKALWDLDGKMGDTLRLWPLRPAPTGQPSQLPVAVEKNEREIEEQADAGPAAGVVATRDDSPEQASVQSHPATLAQVCQGAQQSVEGAQASPAVVSCHPLHMPHDKQQTSELHCGRGWVGAQGSLSAQGDYATTSPAWSTPPQTPLVVPFQQQPSSGAQNNSQVGGDGLLPTGSKFPRPPIPKAAGALSGQNVGQGALVGLQQAQQATDPFVLLRELQSVLEGAGLQPAQLTEFDLAWLGMSAVQRSSTHRAVMRVAAHPGAGQEAVRQAVLAALAAIAAGEAGGDPPAMLCALQKALQDAGLAPAQLTEFEVAWLGMQPQQQQCIHSAIMRAAGGEGAGGNPAPAVRQLAERAVTSLQHASAGPCDPHAMLCGLQCMLEGADLAPGQLTQFEVVWLGQRSAAWWDSIERMVGRAHVQGPDALRQVVGAIIRSSDCQ